ncbi:hypothetical protein B0H14DRAFT_3879706 [Mycena olivaceomarginata]|nr:hypothetical protein B0H14DRAFT_3879706 [Mycena olivaceomarginata]
MSQEVSITDLGLPRLADVRRQLEEATIVVPLTNSFYVPGKLSDPNHVIVEVGTGYFVHQTRAQAVKHYTAKSNLDIDFTTPRFWTPRQLRKGGRYSDYRAARPASSGEQRQKLNCEAI